MPATFIKAILYCISKHKCFFFLNLFTRLRYLWLVNVFICKNFIVILQYHCKITNSSGPTCTKHLNLRCSLSFFLRFIYGDKISKSLCYLSLYFIRVPYTLILSIQFNYTNLTKGKVMDKEHLKLR